LRKANFANIVLIEIRRKRAALFRMNDPERRLRRQGLSCEGEGLTEVATRLREEERESR
jgi:hypothetical protein